MGYTTDTMTDTGDSMSFHVAEMRELIKELEEAGKEMRGRTDAISYSFDAMAETGKETGEPEEEIVKMDGF